ncbi:MAG: putative RNA methyltransferase [Nocardioidaceae bacterium]
MLEDVVPYLVCPYCGGRMAKVDGSLRCESGHTFDIARQGYVSLLPAGWRGEAGDTAAMVDARERFLTAGHYELAATRLAALAEQHRTDSPGCVVDLGAGTGYYLAAVLERLTDRAGLALDVSKPALRRAARAHERVGAVACDIWHGLPIADAAAAVVLNVFAPRNAPELARILHPSGRLLVVTPTSAHLNELVSALDLVTVDQNKSRRLAAQLGSSVVRLDQETVTATLRLSHAEVEAFAAMGPSAWHADVEELSDRIGRLPEQTAVTLSVTVGVYRRLG